MTRDEAWEAYLATLAEHDLSLSDLDDAKTDWRAGYGTGYDAGLNERNAK